MAGSAILRSRSKAMDVEKVESIIRKNDFDDFRWINGKDVEVRQWVRFKCMFGCPGYGKRPTCPPNLPSIPECQTFISEYDKIAVIHIPKKLPTPKDGKEWGKQLYARQLEMERAVFLAGYHKAYLLPSSSCRACEKCADSDGDCKNPKQARPSPEGVGMDVYGTVRKLGYPIEVLTDHDQMMNKYAFLMVE